MITVSVHKLGNIEHFYSFLNLIFFHLINLGRSLQMYIAYSAMLLITPFRRVPKGWRYKHTTTVLGIHIRCTQRRVNIYVAGGCARMRFVAGGCAKMRFVAGGCAK